MVSASRRLVIGALVSAPLLSIPLRAGAADGPVWLEAESFENLGGWVIDQQFMDVMGSPYLLAHGLGRPVDDAVTPARFPKTGRWHAWVRTRNWVANWDAPGAPGRFQVLVGGEPLPVEFGTEGAEWHWQDGGHVQIKEADTTVALHDLTGFEGRCDAVVFTQDDTPPPEDPEELEAFRRRARGLLNEPENAGNYDVVVVGGGIAGLCASIGAARLGLDVALIQDRPVVGGNNSSEVRVWNGGRTNFVPWPRVGDLVRELDHKRRDHPGTGDMYEDDKKLGMVEGEKHLRSFLNWRANHVEMKQGRIEAVLAEHVRTGRRLRFRAPLFVDCTGDGVIGALAGADFDMTVPGHMGRSNCWSLEDTGKPVSFPECPWAHDLSEKPFSPHLGKWMWESGFEHDPIRDGELIRDNNFRAMYGAWDALKNDRGEYPNHRLAWAAYIAGKRESRRLLGDVVLTEEEVLEGREFPDAFVPSSWAIDVHEPDPQYSEGFEGQVFNSRAIFTHFKVPYWVPYRCLYSRNVPNLFMAGRNISVTHDALGTVRVMRTTGMMGEVVAMAASVCRRHEVDPRDVYEHHLHDLKGLLEKGVGLPRWFRDAGANIAREARVIVPESDEPERSRPTAINDGYAEATDNDRRWVSAKGVPHTIEFVWDKPRTIAGARVVSGHTDNTCTSACLRDFVFEYNANGAWLEMPGGRARENDREDWDCRFDPIRTDRARLRILETPGEISRIWEVAFYPPPEK